MGCGCGHIGCGVKIRHVYGNVLRVAVPLILRTIEVEEGVVTTSDAEFVPSSNYPVSIIFNSGPMQVKLLAEMRGNSAYVEDLGTIPVGTYSITVLCKDDQGLPYRFKERSVLTVVDCTDEACVHEGSGYESEVDYLDSAVFFAAGRADRGIDHISTSDVDGVTVVTFYLTDGETMSFTVLSGLEQIVDQDWDIASSRAIANKVVTGFRNDVISALDERSSVSGEILNLKW